MLLYHFPLNTQESIENFTNKGIKNEYSFLNGNGVLSQNGGAVSNICANPNNHKIKINLSQYEELSICFRFFADSSFIGGTSWRSLFGLNLTDSQDNPTCSLFTTLNSGSTSYGGGINYQLDDKWHNVILTIKGTNYTLFYDKVPSNKVLTSSPRILCFFGRLGNNNYNIPIFTQDIRIYDYALSQAEINEYSRALVVHYPLQGNELNDSVLKDVSGFGNDMQRYGGSSSYDNNSPRADKSLHLVNANHCYYQGNMKWSDFASFTISVWIYPTNSSNYRGVIGYRDIDGGVFFACFVTAEITFSLGKAGWTNASRIVDNSPTINEWTHYTMSYNGTTMIIYKNGVLLNSVSVSGTPYLNQPINIARSNEDANRYWDGNISDVRIYATALSAEDIKNLYNSPISVSKQHQTMAFEFKENPLYPSKYWRTPTYAEMNYILNTRTNASSLRTLCRVNTSGSTYVNGCLLLPDDWTLPSGVSMTITTADYKTNIYSLDNLQLIEDRGGVFLPCGGYRSNTNVYRDNDRCMVRISELSGEGNGFFAYQGVIEVNNTMGRAWGCIIRLCHSAQGQHTFSTSASTSIKFAHSNLQYHCTQHIWRFAEHSYDYIGSANANISPTYNGWIDLFGYGTSGVNYSPTLHTTNNADYASGDISNTDNDWGINEIQSYDYNVKNFALNKNGIVQHNELRENDSEVNGCYNDKLITNELIEN